MASASLDALEKCIASISYPASKARYLKKSAQMIVEKFESQIPSTPENLQKLPGVGRKSAHVVASVLYNKPYMAVDTHVMRVSKRLGLVTSTASTPLAIEKQLVHYIPRSLIARAHHWLILHGRYRCTARKPRCLGCPFASFCSHYKKNNGIG